MNSLVKAKNNNLKIILLYYCSIFILLAYGIYKNGWLLYRKVLVSFIYLFKPLILILGSLLLSYGISFLFLKYIKKEPNYLYKLLNNYQGVYLSLIVLSLPINIDFINYFLIIIIFIIIDNIFSNIKFNSYCLLKLIIILSMILLKYYNYQSIYETNVETALTTLDLFMGRSIGGIGTTSVFWMIISYFILSTLPGYKKDIPITALTSYLILMVITLFFNQNIIENFKLLINSETIFGFIFIATIPNYSPIVTSEKRLYAILCGILTFIFNKLINPFEGVFIAILVNNIIFDVIFKFKIDIYVKKIYNYVAKRDAKNEY